VDLILKILSDTAADNSGALSEFDRELQALTHMNHPHIIRLYGYGGARVDLSTESSPRPMLVLEYLGGGTLSSHLSQRRPFHTRPFSPGRTLRMAKELAAALTFMHHELHPNCLLLHRDLKPDNIGFMTDGTLKLMDFGLCVALRRDSSVEGTYELTGGTGSLRYMAPEVARNQAYGATVDVYSFGLIVYEIITGRAPFTGMTREEFYRRVVYGDERPTLDYDDYGRDVRASEMTNRLLSRCWSVCPADRPSAEEALYHFTAEQETRDQSDSKSGFLRRSIVSFTQRKDSI
jgi:serine/threonine protein kinase